VGHGTAWNRQVIPKAPPYDGLYLQVLTFLFSDIDLVVCFSDECHALPTITGVVPLLQGLANFLEKDVSDIIRIKKVSDGLSLLLEPCHQYCCGFSLLCDCI
jgi:hypothetical protein